MKKPTTLLILACTLAAPAFAIAQTYQPGYPTDYTQEQNYTGPQRDQSYSIQQQQYEQNQRMQEMQEQQRYQQQQQEQQFNAERQRQYDQQQQNYQRQEQISPSSCGFGRIC